MSGPPPDRKRRYVAALLVLGASLLVAATVVAVAQWVIFSYDARLALTELTFGERTISVPVMARTVGPGTVLTESDLEVVEMGAAYVAPDVVSRVEDVVGVTVVERLLAGELVRAERLSRPGSGQGLSALVPAGMRALSLNLADGDQVSGFVEPGNSIDLLVTVPGDDDREAETVTLLQTVRVMAVDEKISETADGGEVRVPQVTLAVPPDQVERIAHAVSVGQPKLTLRSDIDVHHQETNGATAGDLLLGTEKDRMTVTQFRAAFDERAVARMVEIVHGRDKQVEGIDPHLLRGID